MKTTKRKINPNDPYIARDYCRLTIERAKLARWKRKNRVKQYKRTIKRILAGENLVPELQTAYRFMRLVMSKERKNADELRFIQGLQMLSKHFSMLAISHMDSVLNKERKTPTNKPKVGNKPICRPRVGNNLALHKTPKMQNKKPCFARMKRNSQQGKETE